MKAADLNTKLINSYLGLLSNLSPANKLDLISKLTQSIKTDIKAKNSSLEKSFGAWQGTETPEDLINNIRGSRQFNRQIEEL